MSRIPERSGAEKLVSEASVVRRPTHRPAGLPGHGRIGAVMLLLFRNHESKGLRFVLTKRRADLRDHPGQISLPGGGREGEEALQETALRETQEEIGIRPESIEILGTLTQVYIPPSDFTIHPFVGWLNEKPRFVIQESEVDSLIEAEVDEICRPESVKYGTIHGVKMSIESAPQRPSQSQFFDICGQQVWGATATVLIDFKSRLL